MRRERGRGGRGGEEGEEAGWARAAAKGRSQREWMGKDGVGMDGEEGALSKGHRSMSAGAGAVDGRE
eukprot:767958-Hanusia_phi.AAC.4